MAHVLGLLLSVALLAAEPEKSSTLRYLKPVGDKYVLEGEVTTTPSDTGSTFVSRTLRGAAVVTLTVRSTKDGQVVNAEAVVENEQTRKTAVLTFFDKGVVSLKRAGITDYLKASPTVVVTTAPDWTDGIQLVRRYDAQKGGKQEFAGMWFHPVEACQTLTLTIERVGKDKIMVNDNVLPLERYQVQLRSGSYLVWADADGKVCKILPQQKGAAPLVLEGVEEATKDLK
jgi:hypothetical protein